MRELQNLFRQTSFASVHIRLLLPTVPEGVILWNWYHLVVTPLYLKLLAGDSHGPKILKSLKSQLLLQYIQGQICIDTSLNDCIPLVKHSSLISPDTVPGELCLPLGLLPPWSNSLHQHVLFWDMKLKYFAWGYFTVHQSRQPHQSSLISTSEPSF